MYTLHKELLVNTSRENAWKFISNPRNLNLITPDDMAFEIISDIPEEMYEGMLAEYRVTIPVIGKQIWISELKHIQSGYSFVDEQRIGPYTFWYHFHGIEQAGDQIRLIDHISYSVPFGFIGRFVHTLFIRATLERIFAHREMMFGRLLGKSS